MERYIEYYGENNCARLRDLANKIIKNKFSWLPQSEYDEFYSIAGQVLWECDSNYSEDKGVKFKTFLVGCLIKKFKSRVTYMNRLKRSCGKADLSLDAIIDDESDTTLDEFIYIPEEEDINPLTQRYLDSLTDLQRQIAELIMGGYDMRSIKVILRLSDQRFNIIWDRMRTSSKLKPLEIKKGNFTS